MTVEELIKTIKVRKFPNFVITPLFVALIAPISFRKTTPLVIILAVVALLVYVPYGIVVCYYVLSDANY